jgi:hypothetical protein
LKSKQQIFTKYLCLYGIRAVKQATHVALLLIFFPFIATFYQIPCYHSLLQQSLHCLAANLYTEFATKYQMASSSSTETNTTTETNPSMTNIPQNPTTPIIPHTPTTPNIL